MIDENDWARLARYVAGDCSPGEAEETRRWIESDPGRREALAFMQGANAAAAAGRPGWDTDASWMRVAARKSARERRPRLLAHVIPSSRPAWRRRAFQIATAAAIAAGGPLLWLWQSQVPPPAPTPVAAREYVTPRAQRAVFHLPDGSRVMLGVASRLRYAEVPGPSGARDLDLDGEALFEVTHDANRPFIVRTAHAVTKDLGTRFTVQAYQTDTASQIVVTEGSVELRSHRLLPSDRGAVLTAGQLGQLGPGGDALVRSGIDVARYLAWTEGRLVFDDVPLRDALPQLDRWYDLDFVLADPMLGRRRFTATLASEAIPQTLELLASSLELRYKRLGRTVTLSAAPRLQ